MNLRSLALLAAFALAACSGGGGGSTPIVPGGGGGIVSPTPTPAPQPTGATASITIMIPIGAKKGSSAKRPAYVSPDTTTLTVLVNTVDGVPPPSWVPASTTTALVVGTNCTTNGVTETCTIPVAAPPGSVSYTFTAGDGTHALSTATATETITQGTNSNLSVTLQGIVASVSVDSAPLNANSPPSGNIDTLTVSALDADSNLIASPGNYNNQITLTDLDATGVTSLSINGGAFASTAVVNSPNDVVTIAYDGQAVNPVAIDASASGVPSASAGTLGTFVYNISLSGTTSDDVAHGGQNTDPNWGQQTLFFAQASGTQDVSADELGWTTAPYGLAFDLVLSAGCSGIASASAGPATTYTITALGNPGVCSARFEEHGTGYPITTHPAPVSGNTTVDGTFWISVTTSSFGVNHTRI